MWTYSKRYNSKEWVGRGCFPPLTLNELKMKVALQKTERGIKMKGLALEEKTKCSSARPLQPLVLCRVKLSRRDLERVVLEDIPKRSFTPARHVSITHMAID